MASSGRIVLSLSFFLSFLLLNPGRTFAQFPWTTAYYWNGGDGNWSDANWLLNGGGSPTSWVDGYGASIGGNHTVVVDQDVNAAQIDLSTGTISQSGHSLVAQSVIMGEYGTGNLNLSGGSIDVSNGYGFMYLGIYGTGNLNVTNGTLNTSYLSVGYNNGTGNANVSGGSLTADTLEVGGFRGIGNMQVSGGAVTANSLNIGNSGSIGTVSISSGTLGVNGSIALGQQGGIGTLQRTGGNLTANVLQVNGLGVFVANDTAGAVTSSFNSLGCGDTGTLIVVPYNGHLDSTEKTLFSTNPATNHGLVGGRAFVQNSQADSTCDFLSAVPDSGQYRLTSATAAGSYTNTDFDGVNAGSVVKIMGTPSALNNTSVYALNLSNGAVTINPGQSLTVSGGGIIMDGGSITGGAMPFGANPAAIYAGASSPNTIASDISGTGGLVKLGPGQLTLSGNNSLSGDLTIANGTLSFGSAGAGGSAGFNNVMFLPGNNATMQLKGNSVTVAAINATGADSVIENAGDVGGKLTINNSTNQVITTFSGILRDGAGGGALSICKDGKWTLALSPDSAEGYTGSTEIAGGELLLDFTHASAPAVDLVNRQSALVMGGSSIPLTTQFSPTLTISGKNSGVTSQTFDSLTLKSGLAKISKDSDTQGAVEVHIGNIVHYGGGVVDFGSNNGASISTTQANDGSGGATTSTGILGGYAVVGSDWAVGKGDGTPIAAYGDYVTSALPTSGTNANNYVLNSNPSTLTDNLTINSLKITGGTAMDLGGKTLSLTSGGLLVTAGSYSINNGQLGANDQETILWQNGSGTLTVNAPISNSGGSLTLAGKGTVKVTSTIPNTVNVANGTLEMSPMSGYDYGGAIFGTGLTKSGTSTLTLSGTNSVSQVRVRSGAIVVPATGVLHVDDGSLYIGFYGGDVASLNIAGGTVITNTVDIGMCASGTCSGTLSISQGSLITKGFLQFALTGGSANQSGHMSVSGGSVTIDGNLTVGSDVGTADLSISGGAITADYFSMGATSNLNLSGGSLAISSGANYWAAKTTTMNISGGTMILGSDTTIDSNAGTTNTINLSGGLLSINGGISHNAGSGTAIFNFNGGTLQARSSTTTFMQGLDHAHIQAGGAIIDTNGNNVTVGQGLEADSPSGGLTKIGAGVLVLGGDNSYSGPTNVEGGELMVNGSIGSSAVTVNAACALSGSGTTGAVTVKSGGILSPGNSPGVLHTGSLQLDNGSTYWVNIAGQGSVAGTNYDQTDVTGMVSLDGSILNLSISNYVAAPNELLFLIRNDGTDMLSGTFAGLSQGQLFGVDGYQFKISYEGNAEGIPSFTGGNDLVLMSVPEPSGLVLLGIGAIGVLAWAWRRRR